MKIMAIVPDKLIDEVRKLTKGSTIEESLIIALEDFVSRQRLRRTIQKIKDRPLSFVENYSAARIRKINRK